MLMLSLNHFNRSIHVTAVAVLGLPQILSFVETRDDAHPKPLLIKIPPLLWLMVCLYVYAMQSQWAMVFKSNNKM